MLNNSSKITEQTLKAKMNNQVTSNERTLLRVVAGFSEIPSLRFAYSLKCSQDNCVHEFNG